MNTEALAPAPTAGLSLQLPIENLKCGGCARQINTELMLIAGVAAVEVDLGSHQVRVILAPAVDAEALRPVLVARLTELGYPPPGEVHGLARIGAAARSVVSCAVGRLRGETDAD